MTEKIKLIIKNTKNIYHEIAMKLYHYRDEETYSMEFVVEGELEKPLIVIKYPGRKKIVREGRIKYGNLFDFLVIPYVDGQAVNERYFTYRKMLKDFIDFKIQNDDFWELILDVFLNNNLSKEPPTNLKGYDPKIYLLALKWMWIQEDFNYRLSYKEIDSPISYMLVNKKNNPQSKGAGRKKFFAALLLAKKHSNYFNYSEIGKIIN